MSKSIEEIVSERNTAWTVSEVMELLHLGKSTVYEMATEGKLKTFRFGSAIRFCPRSLEEYVRQNAM